MADQMSCMGFDSSKMSAFFDWAWPRRQVVDMEDGLYVKLNAGSAIECWVSISREEQEMLDWEVHFASDLRQGCAFDTDVALDGDCQSGLIRVLLHPGEDRETPITVSAPMLAAWADREPGAPGLLQLAFYAEEVRAGGEIGLCGAADENTAALCGVVTHSERCLNPHTGKGYWHIVLNVDDMPVDLLADAAAFETLPEEGTVLSARCVVTAAAESGVTE